MLIGLYFQTSSHILCDRLDYCDEQVFFLWEMLSCRHDSESIWEKCQAKLKWNYFIWVACSACWERETAQCGRKSTAHGVHRPGFVPNILAVVTSGMSLTFEFSSAKWDRGSRAPPGVALEMKWGRCITNCKCMMEGSLVEEERKPYLTCVALSF